MGVAETWQHTFRKTSARLRYRLEERLISPTNDLHDVHNKKKNNLVIDCFARYSTLISDYQDIHHNVLKQSMWF